MFCPFCFIQGDHSMEDIYSPKEGIFWIINNEIVGVKSNNLTKTHKSEWNSFSKFYLDLDGNELPFDYFPRGSVQIEVIGDNDSDKINYYCVVFIDRCINHKVFQDMIIDFYNLGIPEVKNIIWFCERTGIDIYKCHNCKE